MPRIDLNTWQLWATYAAEAVAVACAVKLLTRGVGVLGNPWTITFRVPPGGEWLPAYKARPLWFLFMGCLNMALGIFLASGWAAIVAGEVRLLATPTAVAPGWVYWAVGYMAYGLPLRLLNPRLRKKEATPFTTLSVWLGALAYVSFLIWPALMRATWGWLLGPLEQLGTHLPWLS